MAVHSKNTVYDPNDITRTTIKETLIHDSVTPNMAVYSKTTVYDPDEIAKITIKETLPNDDYHINLNPKFRKATVYDPDDTTKTTVKETTENNDNNGYIFRTVLQDGGAYETNVYEAKNINKQFYCQTEYMGGINNSHGDGYKIENYDMKNTNKQFLSDEYTGITDSKDKQNMSRDDMYNALINDVKETLLYERIPTTEGTKVGTSGSMVNMQPNKLQKSVENDNFGFTNLQSMQSYAPNANTNLAEVTKNKSIYDNYENERLDPSLLEAYNCNPYTQSLTSMPNMIKQK
jgi:hypothetical protein